MKIFAIFATALLATATHAAPDIIEARNLALIPVTFIGAAGESFTQYFPVDDSLHVICNYHIIFLQLPPPHSIIKKFLTWFGPFYSQPPQRLQNYCSNRLHLHFLWCWWQHYRCCRRRTGYPRYIRRASTNDSGGELPSHLGQQNRSCASSPGCIFTRRLRKFEVVGNLDVAFNFWV